MEQTGPQSIPKPIDGIRLLSPVASPGKIIAAPVNYKKHLEEVLAQKEIHHGNLINEIHKAGLILEGNQFIDRCRRNHRAHSSGSSQRS